MPEFRIAFTANDYAQTVAFFSETMGLEILRSFEGGTILLAADGQIEVFEPGQDSEPGVAGVMLAWEVADADRAHAELRERGAPLLGDPQQQPWGHKSFAVSGPDGWKITLYEIVVPQ